MSSHDSPQNQLNTPCGTRSRNSVVMDLFDHGANLAVVGGKLVNVSSLTISMNMYAPKRTASMGEWHEASYNQGQYEIFVTIETTSNYNLMDRKGVSNVPLYNNKHKVIFENANMLSCERDGDMWTLELAAEDYSVSTEWNQKFS